jgi:mitotic spindle assembly checkpoint protein MAD2B
VDAARAQIAKGAVERLAVVIYGSGGSRVMERWMFDVARFPVWKGLPRDGKGKEKAWGRDDDNEDGTGADGGVGGLASAGPGGEQQSNQSKINWTNIDEQLRAAVRRLAYAGEKMTPLSEGCTFTVAVELRDEAEAPIGVSAVRPIVHCLDLL